jgi:AcrR family transcriptional regulator
MSEKKQAQAPDKRPRGRPKLEDVALIGSNLMVLALREFLAHGYGGTSMARVVKAAGISKATMYSRFSSKEALFRAIMRQQMERMAASTALISAHGPVDLAGGLKAYANRSLAYSLESDQLAVNRLIYSESHRFPELGAAAAERTQVGIAQISWFIRQRAEADGIPCRDPSAVAEAFTQMLRGWYLNAMLTDREVTASKREKWVEQAVHVLISARSDW